MFTCRLFLLHTNPKKALGGVLVMSQRDGETDQCDGEERNPALCDRGELSIMRLSDDRDYDAERPEDPTISPKPSDPGPISAQRRHASLATTFYCDESMQLSSRYAHLPGYQTVCPFVMHNAVVSQQVLKPSERQVDFSADGSESEGLKGKKVCQYRSEFGFLHL